ncbi:MAG: peptidase [Alphaproteobacteria bacterium]|nr:peptidase [Alphaproteobacteria bacterium]
MYLKNSVKALAVACAITFAGVPATAKPDVSAVLETYTNIAHATYEDSLITAKTLQTAVQALLAHPDSTTLKAARNAWIAARAPYQQSEVFRFGNPLVDEWEGKVNAWPLDEGLIDYVDASQYGVDAEENKYRGVNIIANKTIRVSGSDIDVSNINKALLSNILHELGGVEANVATGYHAIEFLLWGQDLNGNGPGAGARPATDFDTANCTNGNCDRRAAYLQAATDLLLDDLSDMVAQWAPNGAARKSIQADGTKKGVARALTGMGSLAYGELAGERMKLGLMLHDPEEEHDCFSDNTHNSHFYDAQGIQNVYLGNYKRTDGRMVSGPSLSSLVAAKDAELDMEMRARLTATHTAMSNMVAVAKSGKAYDQMIASGDKAGNQTVQAVIDSLTSLTKSVERVVSALDLASIQFEGSDSLDNPGPIFK